MSKSNPFRGMNRNNKYYNEPDNFEFDEEKDMAKHGQFNIGKQVANTIINVSDESTVNFDQVQKVLKNNHMMTLSNENIDNILVELFELPNPNQTNLF